MRPLRTFLLATALVALPRISPGQGVTALDVLDACRSVLADSGKVRFFCRDLHVPSRVRDLTTLEKALWRDSVPTVAELKRAASSSYTFKRVAEQVRADLEQIRFGVDSAVLTDGVQEENLLAIARFIAASPSLRVSLAGFASSSGGPRTNLNLAARRAAYVRAVLLENGVLPEQLAATRVIGDSIAYVLANGQRRNDVDFQRVDVRMYAEPSSMALASSRSLAVSGTGLGTAALLSGLTDYLIAQALEEVQSNAMRTTLVRLCDVKSETAPFIQASCQSLLANGDATYLPSLNRLRAAIRQDLARVPVTLAMHAAPAGAKSCTLLMGARLFVSLSEGESPLDALSRITTAPAPGCVDSLRLRARDMQEYVGVLQTTAANFEALGKGSQFTRDSVANYLVKTAAVNAAPETRAATVERISRLTEAYDESHVAWEAVVKQVREARSDSLSGGSRERLAALIGSGMPMLLELLPDGQQAEVDTLRRIVALAREGTSSLAAAQYADAISWLLQAANLAGISGKVPLGTLAFVSDIAQAGSSKEVTEAFTRYSHPDRGVARKRVAGSWYGMVNAYLGLGAGRERVGGKYAGVSTLYAPVGFEFGRAASGTTGRGVSATGRFASTATAGGATPGYLRSVGVLFHLVDLGALAAVRIGGADTVSQTPPPTFASVWAPGAMLRFGLGEGRFVAGLGAEYLPVARRGKTDGDWLSGVRQVVTFAVDVPLFP